MTMQVHQVYLSLGSNLGNRQQNLSRAITLITNRIGLIKDQSDLFVTEPVGFTSAHLFINMVVRLEPALTAIQVLKTTQQIEKELGRKKKSANGIYHDRQIDIDILLYDEEIILTSSLTIPHPHMKERRFVLEPMAQIAPQLIIPNETKTIAELLADIC